MKNFHVGLPCLKLSLNPSTQTHNGRKARTCSVGCAWDEMNDKRKGKDRSIDHDLTENNVWLAGSTDIDMPQAIQKEIDRINAERAEYGKRKMRSDAISAIELIQKPPMDVMETLSREEQLELLKISDEVVESILHDWAPEWKTMATVIHFDEMGGRSPHPHKIFMPIARDGDGCPELNAKRDFNLKFFTFMNREYPVRMRERGFPVLNCKIYEDLTEEEKEQHKEEKKDYGLEGYEYKKKKSAEQEEQIKANDRIIEGQTETISSQEDRIVSNNATLSRQREENQELGIRIMSKKQVMELPEPRKSFDGYYKIPITEYRSLMATAGQVDEYKKRYDAYIAALNEKENELDRRSAALDQREAEMEKKSRLPLKERLELGPLRLLKKSVEWLVKQPFVPDIVRKLLDKALNGEDLSQNKGLEFLERQRIKEIAR